MKAQLEVGQKVRLKVFRREEEKEAQVYETKVVDLREEIIELDFSFAQGDKPTGIRSGKQLTLVFVEYNGLYKQKVKVQRFKRKPILSLEVVRKGELEKLQRRKHVRVPVEEDVKYTDGQTEFRSGLMIDISGGGVKLKINELEDLEEGSQILLKLLPLSLSQKEVKGEIVRITEEEDPDTGEITYNLGIKFVDLSDQVREEIIEWGFVKQRELRRKGLI